MPRAHPSAGRTLAFKVGTFNISGTTDAAGIARVSLPSGGSNGTSTASVSFAGDACALPSKDEVTILRYLSTGFVIWGGNSPGLELGQRVNFWGHSWDRQVQGGEYGAQADFKGWAGRHTGLCQENARVSGAPRLELGCWDSKTGNSFPPAQLPPYIGVLVSSAIDKSKGVLYGNVAGLAVVKVSPTPTYGPVPGKPGWGELVAVLAPGEVLPTPVSVLAAQRQPLWLAPGESFEVSLDLTNASGQVAQDVQVDAVFFGSTPTEDARRMGALAAGEGRTLTFTQVAPPVAAKEDAESADAYLSRLAALDGTATRARSTVRYSDPLGGPALPVSAVSMGRVRLPLLSLALSTPTCAGACGSLVLHRPGVQPGSGCRCDGDRDGGASRWELAATRAGATGAGAARGTPGDLGAAVSLSARSR